ncbi:hypothetical protein RHMOL_Rhmol01G0363900 [Rhododendron molle]|uniref:Uncharacterized protein n=1 Tax=Rhododendron molle TaxID=49168 RepID=A0ACC0QCK6_RHOML|nr:hypothetical protein RHMOL_Rhmol01G0363900 [Rhododendron molle]
MAVRLTWSSAFRAGLFLILLAAIASAFITLPVEKILKDFLLWVKHDLGPWGPLALAVAYIPLTVLAVPASVLTLGGGYLFGLPVGFVADSIGATLGATAAFLLGRTIGRSYVISKLKKYPKFQAVAIATQRSGFKVDSMFNYENLHDFHTKQLTQQNRFVFLERFCVKVQAQLRIVLLLRLVPLLPFNMLNYLLSVTPVPLGEYMMASWVGMMPITFTFVYVGTTLKDLSDVTHGWAEVSKTRWALMAAGFLISVLLMVVTTKVAKASLDKALAEDGDIEGILGSPRLPIVAEPPLDLQKPLIIKIDSPGNHHEKQ